MLHLSASSCTPRAAPQRDVPRVARRQPRGEQQPQAAGAAGDGIRRPRVQQLALHSAQMPSAGPKVTSRQYVEACIAVVMGRWTIELRCSSTGVMARMCYPHSSCPILHAYLKTPDYNRNSQSASQQQALAFDAIHDEECKCCIHRLEVTATTGTPRLPDAVGGLRLCILK
jgi:hypothetical protein